MTQRIVIKTAVSKVPQASTEVSYQWHWRRIFAASSAVLLFAAALVYGLLNSVNAIEMTTMDSQSQSLVDSEAALVADSEQVDTISAPSDVSTDQDVESVTTQELVLASDNVREAESVEATDVVTDDGINELESVLSQQPDNEIETANAFAEDANITNVALGAQIDSNLVSRAVLTTGIADREPIDVLKEHLEQTDFTEKLFFFTEINNMQGQTVQHLWFHQDQLMAEIPLQISAIRFRTYSSKNIMPSQTGPWRVEVVTEQGQLLAQKSFRILSEAD
ncbi:MULTISPECIES: DUF2914 domain-containing protein [Pseudoalteromonas]|uniref:DUF2914 domain-containing protein n=1 Tax=Pseudoalteromonas amylolytica TaxID=1859457 RepID=A0A1S1MZP1_9GAMM|nr:MULTISPECIES: DUF2914 domain-containing protein [Pseudoalteromonas]OHU84585.1 hypothetical protein BFC16_00500 [Pseudoalteromonas sp. JW3]OHU92506.1 hypothetical protein BET10_05490 [Pseudoalteromonas amylolytica]